MKPTTTYEPHKINTRAMVYEAYYYIGEKSFARSETKNLAAIEVCNTLLTYVRYIMWYNVFVNSYHRQYMKMYELDKLESYGLIIVLRLIIVHKSGYIDSCSQLFRADITVRRSTHSSQYLKCEF